MSQDAYVVDPGRRVVSINEQQHLEKALAKSESQAVNKHVEEKPGINPDFDRFYKQLSAMASPSKVEIKSLLKNMFPGDKVNSEQALWFALNTARSDGSRALSTQLQQLVSDDFISRLNTSPPTTIEELKAELKQDFQFSSRRETALWEAWGHFKNVPDKTVLVDLIRDELGHLIQLNSIMRNMMTNTTRPDIF
ncbi:hypothetical protein HQQ94_00385 [Shewanella sp. VB17]|uniref:YopR/YscH family type III secretion effector n=1 Tax=Shewanella sp. VB17 TaxID=2739432 RepID=UPI0015653867|nr:YopR/YscH family type III secretion effector [Shewanella sp. VB17]NRD71732.1 hypothetical protein [Shewanella sp. VB17]